MQQPDIAQNMTGMRGTNISGNRFDTSSFITHNRIHVEHGSLILPSDPLLPLHPRELKPENEPKLREKIHRAYTIDGYSFFDSDKRAGISAALSGLIPLSTKTKEAALGKQLTEWIRETQTGEDAERAKRSQKKAEPFKAVIEQYLDKPENNPAIVEFSQNAIGMYLVMQEALRSRGYRGSVAEFTDGVGNAEGLIAKLSTYLGYDTHTFMETARSEGVDGIGKLLGVDPAFMKDVSKLNAYLPEHKFSVNTVMNWQVGRHLPGMKSAGVAEKIAAGAEARVNAKIMSSRMALQHRYKVPPPVQQQEETIAGMLTFLPPELSETLFRLGTEIAFTPEYTLSPISNVHAHGFHRRITQNPDDVHGIYHIFVSGKADAEEAVRVLVHEAHHLLMPSQFSEKEIALVDELASHDMMRLKALKELTDQWMTGDDATKAQVVETLNRPEFSVDGQTFSQSIGQSEMLTFYHQVQHAYQRLQIDSEFYHRSGYNEPESRFQEINSRYAEMRYVRQRENPDMLKFITPGITAAYEQIYMPHVREQLNDLRQRDAQNIGRTSAPAPSPVRPNNPVATATAGAPDRHSVTAEISDDVNYLIESHAAGTPSNSIEAPTAQHELLFSHPGQTRI